MSPILKILQLAFACFMLAASAHGQTPYTSKPSKPAGTGKVVKKIPPPHPTMNHYSGTTSGGSATGRRTYAPGYAGSTTSRQVKHRWKKDIVTTVFWVGEKASARNPTHNMKSSWDTKWMQNFGGYDNPDKKQRNYNFTPKGFTPRQNPFYCALPYNDVQSWNRTKPEARHMIPWFSSYFKRQGRSVCKGRWIAIHHNGKTCFAQWEDVGPFRTDDWSYVFGQSRPANQHNNGAGLDVSPAVRDYLGLRSGQKCHWRFAELHEVRPGPWKKYGDNNHFVKPQAREQEIENTELERLRKMRDAYLQQQRR